MPKEVATNMRNVLLACGLRIRLNTIGGFLHFIRQVAHCAFMHIVPLLCHSFIVNIVYIYRLNIRVRVTARVSVRVKVSIT